MITHYLYIFVHIQRWGQYQPLFSVTAISTIVLRNIINSVQTTVLDVVLRCSLLAPPLDGSHGCGAAMA
ncbi:uncharacterized protein YALI1_D25831g [Yarrowia lipolytica]|uniref:Uncharacterized protein n=1 Tax=Yarrowia lipolytica TaxID=4952 RepID=A0A1D8NFF2_YARLL|nr:hypothetical protein YALI1_D25831g [Yarrowia lipolytica]